MTNALWILESINDRKFPYLLTIRQGKKTLLRLRVQDRWPGQRGNIFCLQENSPPPSIVELERVPVISLNRFGKRLAIVLDRPVKKRCDFLFLIKEYKTKEGKYEQIFWRTQQALNERRPRVKLSTYTSSNLTVTIDTGERYPWSFPQSTVLREKLPAGDYALRENNLLIAVVERKTFENLSAEFGRMAAFHQQLIELESYKHAALVIEANYSDFLNPGRMEFYTPSFTAKAIGELHAFHPHLSIVFAGNRKLAREWTHKFFSAVKSHREDIPHTKISQVMAQYHRPPETTGGSYYEIRESIEETFPLEFTISMLRESFPNAPEATLKRVLMNMKKEGMIEPQGKGKKRFWRKQQHQISRTDTSPDEK